LNGARWETGYLCLNLEEGTRPGGHCGVVVVAVAVVLQCGSKAANKATPAVQLGTNRHGVFSCHLTFVSCASVYLHTLVPALGGPKVVGRVRYEKAGTDRRLLLINSFS